MNPTWTLKEKGKREGKERVPRGEGKGRNGKEESGKRSILERMKNKNKNKLLAAFKGSKKDWKQMKRTILSK